MAYAPTVQAEAGFTANSMHHYGEVLGEPRTDSLSHADVYAGLQTAIAILAALHRRATTGAGQYIDVAMAATLMAVNERAHVDLNDADLGDEPAILGATDCPFFKGPGGEHFTVATSLVGSRTFPLYLRAMRRADLADDPRFATAAARKAHFTALHHIVQTWILTFSDIGALDAQLDEAKIALGEVRSLKRLSQMEWAEYWGAIQESLRPQWRNLPPAWPSVAVLARKTPPARRSCLPGRTQPRGVWRARSERRRNRRLFRIGRAGERRAPRNDRRRCRRRRQHGHQSAIAVNILNRRPPRYGGPNRQHLAAALTLGLSCRRISHEALKRAPRQVARHDLTLDEGAHRGGIADLAAKCDRTDQGRQVGGIGERVGYDLDGIGRIWPGDAQVSSAARANDTRQHRP